MSSHNCLLGLYVHWPYCASKCPYCDFFSVVQSPNEDMLLAGYARDCERFHTTEPLTSIFIGGGTPSMMSLTCAQKLLDIIREHFSLAPDCEITLEANPNALTATKVRAFAEMGFNRLSLGIQALNDTDLKALGRTHTTAQALQALDWVKNDFTNFNIDLIYTRMGQTGAQWEKELSYALTLNCPHYSLYQLTLEPGTVFYHRPPVLPTDEEQVRLFQITDTLMNEAGISGYEVSNYAHPDKQCRHNLTYWRYQPYIGIGPSAHSRFVEKAFENPRSIGQWLKGTYQCDSLTPRQMQMEYLLMHLRLRQEGTPLKVLSPTGLQQAKALGWIDIKGDRCFPTTAGTLMLNTLTDMLCP